MRKIHPTAIIYPNVQLPEEIVIGPFCIIGESGLDDLGNKRITTIQDGAIIRSHSVIYAGNQIGKNFRTGHHVVIRENNEIGDDVSIGTQSCVEHHCQLEKGVRIHSQVFVPEYTVLKEKAWLGPNAVLTNAKYPTSKDAKKKLAGCTVESKAIIGANSTILPGKIIGGSTLVGAGSVVTKDTEQLAVVIGNPAKKISSINEIEDYNQ